MSISNSANNRFLIFPGLEIRDNTTLSIYWNQNSVTQLYIPAITGITIDVTPPSEHVAHDFSLFSNPPLHQLFSEVSVYARGDFGTETLFRHRLETQQGLKTQIASISSKFEQTHTNMVDLTNILFEKVTYGWKTICENGDIDSKRLDMSRFDELTQIKAPPLTTDNDLNSKHPRWLQQKIALLLR